MSNNNSNIDYTIIGAGLTGLTLAFYLKRAGKKVLVIEKDSKTGGVINTIEEKGFVYETGPNTGVIGSTELVELFDDLGIKPEIANPKAKYRWIWKGNKWRPLPSGVISAVTTPLFSLKDKFRILGEPFRKPGTNPDESVADLVLRRMGTSFLNYAIDPFIGGIYAGDPSKLVTRYALPKLYNLEQNYGSFIKGAMKKRKEPKTDLEKRVSKEVFSVKGGLKNLIEPLTNQIGKENFILNIKDLKIEQVDGTYNLKLNEAGNIKELSSKNVITTIDPENISEILTFLPKNDIQDLSNLNYAKVVQVIAGYNKWEGISINAFGGLVPSRENRNSLGILFPSSIFDGRAPKEGAILSIFMGGLNKPEMIEKNDEEIKQIALREISETLNSEKEPDLIKICRYQKAIPQYEITSGIRFDAINRIQQNYPGLILAGNIRDGIGMADRVKQAKQLALEILNN